MKGGSAGRGPASQLQRIRFSHLVLSVWSFCILPPLRKHFATKEGFIMKELCAASSHRPQPREMGEERLDQLGLYSLDRGMRADLRETSTS